MGIFDRRLAFKPFEYPELVKYKEAIQHSYWLVSEWNFTSDVQDFNTKLTKKERSVVKNALLAISQIEVSVKRFWADLGRRFPKPEIEQIGIVYGESEVRHSDAYSHLLEVLSLNDDFTQLLQNPQIQGRVDYLTKYLKGASDNSNESYTLTLVLFSIFIENVSLFSQFLIIKAFNKYKNYLKDIDNVVDATQKEEQTHALFGVKLVEIIKSENPDWFNEDFYNKLERACKKALVAEEGIIDWIFEKGELDFISSNIVKEFVRDRFNKSLLLVGGKSLFEVDNKVVKNLKWFDEESTTDISTDFFHKKPVTYSKKLQSITEGDLF
jgi:ribonucleoside-diphosphate reductase beta chain